MADGPWGGLRPLYDLADPAATLHARLLADLSDLPTRLVQRLEVCGYRTIGQIAGMLSAGGEEQAAQWLGRGGVKGVDALQVLRCVAKVMELTQKEN